MPKISLIIPTQRRPGGLSRAVHSVFGQEGVDFSDLELVIVDNDQVPSAEPIAGALAEAAPFPVIYEHEPRAGVSNARNAAMARASGELIVFLDDDEEAPSTWLAALLAAQARLGVDAVFGPVRARAPDYVRRHRPYLERFFSRLGPASEQPIEHHYGCGDSIVRRAAMPHPTAPFSAIRNEIGGEDDLMFDQMKAKGARFGWAPDAWVWEDPVPERLTLGYTIPRAFAYGQGPSAACASASPPNRVGIARWMAIGVVQAMVFGALAVAKWLVFASDRAEALDRAARGLGKALWWGPFKIQFYGRTAAGAAA